MRNWFILGRHDLRTPHDFATCKIPHFSATDRYERLRRLSISATAATLRCSAQILCRCIASVQSANRLRWPGKREASPVQWNMSSWVNPFLATSCNLLNLWSFFLCNQCIKLKFYRPQKPPNPACQVVHYSVWVSIICLWQIRPVAPERSCRCSASMWISARCFLHQLSQADDGPAVSKEREEVASSGADVGYVGFPVSPYQTMKWWIQFQTMKWHQTMLVESLQVAGFRIGYTLRMNVFWIVMRKTK